MGLRKSLYVGFLVCTPSMHHIYLTFNCNNNKNYHLIVHILKKIAKSKQGIANKNHQLKLAYCQRTNCSATPHAIRCPHPEIWMCKLIRWNMEETIPCASKSKGLTVEKQRERSRSRETNPCMHAYHACLAEVIKEHYWPKILWIPWVFLRCEQFIAETFTLYIIMRGMLLTRASPSPSCTHLT